MRNLIFYGCVLWIGIFTIFYLTYGAEWHPLLAFLTMVAVMAAFIYGRHLFDNRQT